MQHLSGSPATLAAEKAQAQIHECIDKKQRFLVEAGAGAGKTESLVVALRHLIAARGRELLQCSQQVACITYTNLGTEEIRGRIDNSPVVACSTIHSFCWALAGRFQSESRTLIPSLHERWPEKIEESGIPITHQRVTYDDLGHRRIDEAIISLFHDDVIELFCRLLENEKFRVLLADRFPVIFVDEYQDTSKKAVDAIRQHLFPFRACPLFGFFGDHWQQIYERTCGAIDDASLTRIPKGANFRSSVAVVDFLNHMRPELKQGVADPTSQGSVTVYHTNEWPVERRSGYHWGGDLPDEAADCALGRTVELLQRRGWNFTDGSARILMLTHNGIADRNRYRDLANVFEFRDQLVKKQDPFIAYFLDMLEPACEAYQARRYGEMLTVLGHRTEGIRSLQDKRDWANEMDTIAAVRAQGTVGDVIDCIRQMSRCRLPDAVLDREAKREKAERDNDEEQLKATRYIDQLKTVSYQQVVAVKRFIDEKTPFATKHGVKGAQFENVLVVCHRGWGVYNFGEMLESFRDVAAVSDKARPRFEQNRNLFYVASSRAQKEMVFLFTQWLSNSAMQTMVEWCGDGAVNALESPPST